MIIILRSFVYTVILLVSSVSSLTAKGDAGPPYNGGVFLFRLLTQPRLAIRLNMSALKSGSGSIVPILPTLTRRSMSLWTPVH
jgi:hypothetical protein